MGNVITVWGSPGAGKSMFCCILAKDVYKRQLCNYKGTNILSGCYIYVNNSTVGILSLIHI